MAERGCPKCSGKSFIGSRHNPQLENRKPALPDRPGLSLMYAIRAFATAVFFSLLLSLLSCSSKPDPETLVMIIESSPTNLDPRIGIDDYSERIDNLIFD